MYGVKYRAFQEASSEARADVHFCHTCSPVDSTFEQSKNIAIARAQFFVIRAAALYQRTILTCKMSTI
jgi:hypothetical protein